MAIRGMDVERVDALAAHMNQQAMLIDAIVGVVDGAVAALTGVWFGENLNAFHGAWVGAQRSQAHGAAADIGAAIRALRSEVAQQRATSGGATGGIPGLAGSFPTPGKAAPSDLLAFAKDSEKKSAAFLSHGKADDNSIKLPPGWSVATPAELTKLGIDPSSLHDPRTGFDATIYSNGHGGYVVSYSGSQGNPLDPKTMDWSGGGGDYQAIADLPGTESKQVEQAANLAVQVAASAGKGNVVFTGHSLGGREAAVASVATGGRAVTFNPTGTTTEDLLYANALAGRSENAVGMLADGISGGAVSHATAEGGSDVTNYVMTNDIAQGTHNSAAKDYLGQTNYVVSEGLNPIEEHSASKFDGRI